MTLDEQLQRLADDHAAFMERHTAAMARMDRFELELTSMKEQHAADHNAVLETFRELGKVVTSMSLQHLSTEKELRSIQKRLAS